MMGRRRQKDEGFAGALFDVAKAAIALAWASRPLYGLLTGLGIAALFCGLIPALLALGIPSNPADVTAPAAGVGALLLGFAAKGSVWFGGVIGVVCVLCALINVFRQSAGGVKLSLVPPSDMSTVKARTAPAIPFIRKDLMTPTELVFFKRLCAAFPDVQVCPQVALAAVVDIPAKFNNNRYKHANRSPFAAKYADFAIVDRDTGGVHAIIELDDHTHDSPERKEEDAARDAMLEDVGIPVHRFDARKMPDVTELQAWFEEA